MNRMNGMDGDGAGVGAAAAVVGIIGSAQCRGGGGSAGGYTVSIAVPPSANSISLHRVSPSLSFLHRF